MSTRRRAIGAVRSRGALVALISSALVVLGLVATVVVALGRIEAQSKSQAEARMRESAALAAALVYRSVGPEFGQGVDLASGPIGHVVATGALDQPRGTRGIIDYGVKPCDAASTRPLRSSSAA